MAVMEGFQRDLRARLRGSLADIVVRPRVDIPLAELLRRAEAVPGVAAATPRAQTQALIKTPTSYVPVQIMAVDPVREARVSEFGRFTGAAALARAREAWRARVENTLPYCQPDGVAHWKRVGAAVAALDPADAAARLRVEQAALADWVKPAERAVAARLIGYSLAEFEAAAEVATAAAERLPLPDGPFDPAGPVPVQLGRELAFDLAAPGSGARSKLELLTARVDAEGRIDEEASQEPIDLLPTGRFRSGQFELDSQLVLVPIAAAWATQLVPDQSISELAVRVADGAVLPDVERALAAAFPSADVLTWMEQRRSLLRAVRLEKGFLGVLFLVITLCAGFVMFVTFFNMVHQKRRDIGLLCALGARPRGAAAIFCTSATIIGVVSCGLGVALGLWGASQINLLNAWLKIFPPSLYYMDKVPAVVELGTVAWILGATFGITLFLGGLVPAWFAARVDPVQALRYE